jgi:hypothetical protein
MQFLLPKDWYFGVLMRILQNKLLPPAPYPLRPRMFLRLPKQMPQEAASVIDLKLNLEEAQGKTAINLSLPYVNLISHASIHKISDYCVGFV